MELRLGSDSKYTLNGGINLQYNEGALDITQSPLMENLNADDRGTLTKRYGQAFLLDNDIGTGAINGIYANYKGFNIIAHGTKLYKQEGNNPPLEIYSSLTNSKAFLFVFNGVLYLINGTNYIKYDGTTVSNVEPYIPTVTLGRKPDGLESTLNEPLNLLGSGFTDSFTADGTSNTYKLSFNDLDATTVKAIVNNVEIIEGSGLTVNRTTGEVTFTVIPADTKTPNNVKITAHKANPSGVQQILKCNKGMEFSSSMWLFGNGDYKNRIFKTGLTDKMEANYFPASGFRSFSAIGYGDEAVTGLCTQYDKLIIFKEKSIHFTYAETQSDGNVGFPIKLLNSQVGCDVPNSIQLVNNNPVFCNTQSGVFIIVSTQIEGEKNVINISQNINGLAERPGLLQEDLTSLKNASSIDYGQKYYLCIGSRCYVWDYDISFSINKSDKLTWFLYTNVKAKEFFILNNDMYYLHNERGNIVRFVNVFNDFSEPIRAIWRSKLMDFSRPDFLKNVKALWITTRTNSTMAIKYYNEKNELVDSAQLEFKDISSYTWSNFKWNKFTWKVYRFPPTIKKKIKMKKIVYFQLELTNNIANENLSIISLALEYELTKKVK